MIEESREFNSTRFNIQRKLKLGEKHRFEGENNTILEKKTHLIQFEGKGENDGGGEGGWG